VRAEPASAPAPDTAQNGADSAAPSWQAPSAGGEDAHMDHSGYNAGGDQSYDNAPMEDDNYGPINVKEDG
jgi:RNA-binding protein Musashi